MRRMVGRGGRGQEYQRLFERQGGCFDEERGRRVILLPPLSGIFPQPVGRGNAHQVIELIDPLSLAQVDPFRIPLHPVAKVQQ